MIYTKSDLISIIIPVYNSEKFLKKCLDSIINQTYENIEIICVNDGSKDNSLKILHEYEEKDSRFLIIDKVNQGVSTARNYGIRKSNGKFITFVDSDDWIESNAIEILYNTLMEKKVDAVRGNYFLNSTYETIDFIGNMHGIGNQYFNTLQDDFGELIIDKLLDSRLPCFAVLFLTKRECVLKTNLFRSDIHMMEDTIFINELMNVIDSIYFLDVPIYHYYHNENSASRSSEYFLRNIYNLTKVSDCLKKVIKSGRFYNENRINIINSNISRIMLDYIYSIFKTSKMSLSKFCNILKELEENEYVLRIFKHSYESGILVKKFYKLSIKLINKNKNISLYFYYMLREIFIRVKKYIKAF